MAGMKDWKLRQLRSRYDASAIRVFVETGTFKGATTKLAQEQFSVVHTIELDPVLHMTASTECAHPSTTFHLGDTRDLLPKLAQEITEPVLWYLDAHWFKHPGVAGKEKGLPLWDELRVLAARSYADVIVVDDVHDFGTAKPTPEWLDVTLERIAEIFPGHQAAIITYDQAAVYR
jgi:hypothetical protein